MTHDLLQRRRPGHAARLRRRHHQRATPAPTSTSSARPTPFFVWVSNFAPHRAKKRNERGRVRLPGAAGSAHVLTDVKLPALTEAVLQRDERLRPAAETHVAKVGRAEMQTSASPRASSASRPPTRASATRGHARRATASWTTTYIFFVSDNGYLLGEHRLSHKNFIFRESMAVPYAGPGAGRGRAHGLRVPGDPHRPGADHRRPGRGDPGAAGRRQSFAPLLRGEPLSLARHPADPDRQGSASHESWRIRGHAPTATPTGGHDRRLRAAVRPAPAPRRDPQRRAGPEVPTRSGRRCATGCERCRTAPAPSCGRNFGPVPPPSSPRARFRPATRCYRDSAPRRAREVSQTGRR